MHETGAQNRSSLSGRFRARLGDKRKERANHVSLCFDHLFGQTCAIKFALVQFAGPTAATPRLKESIISLWCHSALGSMQLWRQLLGHTRLCQPGEFVRHFIEFTRHMLCDDFFNVVQLEQQSDFCSNPI